MSVTRRGELTLLALAALLALLAGATAKHWDPYARHLGRCQTTHWEDGSSSTDCDGRVSVHHVDR